MMRLTQVISKNRRLTPQTLQLFLSPSATKLELFDCSGACTLS